MVAFAPEDSLGAASACVGVEESHWGRQSVGGNPSCTEQTAGVPDRSPVI